MSQADTYPRVDVQTEQRKGRLRRALDTLQDTIRQPVETVTRSAVLKVARSGIEDVNPPDDIDEYVELYYDVGAIRKNLNEFVDDVTAPGLRVSHPDDSVEAYFNGGDEAPDGAPAGGFLAEAYINDQKRQPLDLALDQSTLDRWRRGTVMLVNVYADPDDPESIISGFTFVRPETVSARTYKNTNQLIEPDVESPENDGIDYELTPRGEASAFVQFDEQSIIGRRRRRQDRPLGTFGETSSSVYLSQNDVTKVTLDQDIGGDRQEEGVFGESVIRSISDEATQYNQIKRLLEESVRGKAWGLWTAQMNPMLIDAGDEKILIEWDDRDIQDTEKEIENIGPGSVLTTDAQIDLERHDGEVPNIEWLLKHYLRDIVDPLPAPFYKHSQADEINQFVTDEQQEDYQQRIQKERRVQAEAFESALRKVVERHPDLDAADDLSVEIAPESDDSPIRTLTTEEVEKIQTYMAAVQMAAPADEPTMIMSEAEIRELILQLPEEMPDEVAQELDMTDPDAMTRSVEEITEQYAEADD